MSFEASLMSNIQKLKWKHIDLLEKIHKGEHSCDCDYCYVEREDGLDEDVIETLYAELSILEDEIKRCERYAKERGLVKGALK